MMSRGLLKAWAHWALENPIDDDQLAHAEATKELVEENARYREALQAIVDKYWTDTANEKETCWCCWSNLRPELMGKHGQLNGDPCPIQIAREALKGSG